MTKREKAFLAVLASVAAATLIFFGFQDIYFGTEDPQYLWLASSFLHGRLDLPAGFVASHGPLDMVARNGRYYWPLGPLPALIFAPFVAFFGPVMAIESMAHCLLAGAAFALAYLLARRSSYGKGDAIWLAAAFCLGSVVIGLAFTNGPWFFENLLSAVLLLAALVERKGKDRPLAIGVLVALAGACRLTAFVAAGYFVLREILERRPAPATLRRLAVMAAPVIVAVIALGAYDAARFGSPFDTGQRDHILKINAYSEGRDLHGVFSPVNVPGNFFKYFLKPPFLSGPFPIVDVHGVSVVLLSPVFLWALALRHDDPDVIATVISTAALLAVLLSYFTDGSWQFGPRYLADAAPFWFLLLLKAFRGAKLKLAHKAAIGASAAANIGLFWIFALHFIFRII